MTILLAGVVYYDGIFGGNMKKVHRIRIYPYFLLKYQDQWLHKMSLNGLHLVNYGLLHYTFAVG